MNIYEKLIEVRKAVPYLQKTNLGAQYKYVGSSDVLGALREAMDAHGLLVIPRVTKISVTISEGENSKGNKTAKYFTETWLEYTIVNAAKFDETITIPWYAQGLDTEGEKGVGKALTYGEKYLFLKLFNIATDVDDPDAFQRENDAKPARAKSTAARTTPNPGANPLPAAQSPRLPEQKPITPSGTPAPTANAAKAIPAASNEPDWTKFWLLMRNKAIDKAAVHTEAAPYFEYHGEVKSLTDIPNLSAEMLTKFGRHMVDNFAQQDRIA